MMRWFILLGLISNFSLAQEINMLHLKDSIALQADTFLGVDTLDAFYYKKGNTLFKDNGQKQYSYQNISLNQISNFDGLNPLELTLFYQDFNTVIQLDRRLTELKRYTFNELVDAPIISHASTSSNHRLWLFNENNLQLGVFNSRNNQFEAVSQPISEKIIQIKSNYNFCWVLTSTHILKYNNYGNLINRFEVSEFDDFWNCGLHFMLLKNKELFIFDKKAKTTAKLKTPKIKIKDVFVKAETVYIYNGIKVYTYQLKLN